MPRSKRSLALLSPFVVLVACGGAAPAPQSPAPAGGAGAASTTTLEEPEPATIEEAQALLDRARRELGAREEQSAKPADASASSQPLKSPPGATGGSSPESETKTVDSSCGDACRAIRSMRKAVSAICRMAGDADARCKSARTTLTASEKRAAQCGC